MERLGSGVPDAEAWQTGMTLEPPEWGAGGVPYWARIAGRVGRTPRILGTQPGFTLAGSSPLASPITASREKDNSELNLFDF